MRDFRDRLQDILDAIGQIEVEQVKGRAAFDGSSLIQVWMVHHLADFERLGMKRMSNANQSLGRNGNVGTAVCFRVGREDAEVLERQFAPHFDAQDLTNLPNWEACLKTKVRGQIVAPFSLRTGPPLATPDARAAQQVVALSREKYGRPRKAVLEEIRRSLEPPPAPKTPPVSSHIAKFLESKS